VPDYVASVFVSHAHEDKPYVRVVCTCIAERGCRIWLDEDELRIGDSLPDGIVEAIDEVDFVLALAVTREIRQGTVVVLPVRMDDTPMPPLLKEKLYLDVRSMGPRQAADKIMESIHERSPRRRWRQSPFSALPPMAKPAELHPMMYLPYN